MNQEGECVGAEHPGEKIPENPSDQLNSLRKTMPLYRYNTSLSTHLLLTFELHFSSYVLCFVTLCVSDSL